MDMYMESMPRVEIERVAYQEFLSLWERGTFGNQRLGQAFYNHFRLHHLSDQTRLFDLYEADGDKAMTAISRLFQIR
jgi:hypothetical protein